MATNIFPASDDGDSGPSMIIVSSKGVHWSRGDVILDDETTTETSSVDPVVVVTEIVDNSSEIRRNPSEVSDDAIAEGAPHSAPSIVEILSNLRNADTLDALTQLTARVSTECGTGREVFRQKTRLSKFEQSCGVSIIFLLVALALLLVGTAIALVAYFRLQSSDDTYILKTFDLESEDMLHNIDLAIKNKLREADAIEGIVSARAGPNFLGVTEFNAMMTNLRINSSFSITIAKRVNQADRATALSTISSMYPSQQIVQDFWVPDVTTGNVVISPVATEYVSIYLSYPASNIPQSVNMNLAGYLGVSPSMLQNTVSKFSSYVLSIATIGNQSSYSLSVSRPTFDGIIRPSPPNVLRGIQCTGVTSFKISYADIAAEALSHHDVWKSAINIVIRDENAKPTNGPKVMFSHLNSDAPVLNPADCSDLCRKLSINLESTTIDAYAFVSENWVSSQRSSERWIALFVILFSFVAISVLIVLFGRWMYYNKRMSDEKVAIAELAAASLHMAAKFDTKAREARSETRSRTLLTAMISHEMRTPINHVMGSLIVLDGVATSVFDHIKEVVNNDEIVRIKSDEAMVRECLTDSTTALDSLLTITNDILQISSMELGNFKLNKRRFDIIEAMEGEVHAFSNSTLFTKQNIEFSLVQTIYDGNDGGRVVNVSTKDGRDRLFVCGDDARLRQCLRVLVSNAVKFTENDRSIRVTIDLKKNSGTKLIPSKGVCSCGDVEHCDVIEVIVGVTDTGIGMNPTQTRKLFRTFGQGETGGSDDVSFRRQFGGTGLGLSIIKLLVVNGMGGLVLARSGGKGTGSSFEFRCPLHVYDHSICKESPNVSDVEVIVETDSVTMLETSTDRSSCSAVTMTDSHQKSNEIQVTKTRVYSQGISAKVVDGVDNIDNVVVSFLSCPDKENNGFKVSERECKKGLSVLTNAEVEDIYVETSSLDPSLVQHVSIAMTPMPPTTQMKNAQLRVLVVDDIEMNLKVLSRMVGIMGYRFDTATNGEDSVNMTESAAMNGDPFALILMDVEMPGKYDGFQATERLCDSSVPGVRDITVVAVTAHMMDIVQDRARACGIKRCLSKPVKKHELQEVLSNCELMYCV